MRENITEFVQENSRSIAIGSAIALFAVFFILMVPIGYLTADVPIGEQNTSEQDMKITTEVQRPATLYDMMRAQNGCVSAGQEIECSSRLDPMAVTAIW